MYYRTVYKLDYLDLASKYSKEYDVPVYLVLSIIKSESSFNRNAVSSVGARGLMQITEETFNWLKSKKGEETHQFDDMFNPDINIDYGVFFLSLLQKEFSEEKTVIAAYHAGMNKVSEWLCAPPYSSDGVSLSQIPFKDTRHYVIRVYDTKKMYETLYESK